MKQKERVAKFLTALMWVVVALMLLATLSGQVLFTGNVIGENLEQTELDALYNRLGTGDLGLQPSATLNDLVNALFSINSDLGGDVTIALFDAGYFTFNTRISEVVTESGFIQATTANGDAQTEETPQEQEETSDTQDLLKELEEAVEEIKQEKPELVEEVTNSVETKKKETRNKELGIRKEEATRVFIPKPTVTPEEIIEQEETFEPYEPPTEIEQKNLGTKTGFFSKILRFLGIN